MVSFLTVIAKAACTLAICWCYHYSYTAPHTAQKGELVSVNDWTDWWFSSLLQRTMIRTRRPIIWLIGIAELAFLLSLPPMSENIHLSSGSLLGVSLAIAGTYLRKVCYDTMADNFTFSLALRKNHTLVTGGPYSIVRHPAYTSYILLYAGIGLWHASATSWARNSSVPHALPIAGALWGFAVYNVINLYALFSRMSVEDRMLKEKFGKEWEGWANKVPYSLIPYVF